MSLIRVTLAQLRAIHPLMWIAVLVATTGTNLLDFFTVPVPGTRPGGAFIGSAIVRVIVVVWVGYALQRQLGGGDRPFRPSAAMGRFVLLTIAGFALMGVAAKLASIARGPGPVPLATEWLYAFLALAIFGLITVRLLAWTCALAVGEPFAALPAVWRGQEGHVVAIAGAFVGLVLPIAAVHAALSLMAIHVPMTTGFRVALGVTDGIVSAFQLAVTDALAAVAWRIARPIEAAAAPR